ncbi:hypothetical protein RugamoR57_52140 [Duganella caerulea]|uniref:ATP-binding protein n=1 Tax=Duganella caerulea TaxID=2885762 RepID=UPI0030E9AB98
MAELDPSPLSLATHGSSHFVRFYKDDSLLLDEVAPFVHQALAAGGASIVIATAEHLAALRRRLARLQAEPGGSDPGARLVTRDADQTLSSFMLDDWPDATLFDATVGQLVRELEVGSATIHAFGEMVALLCERGNYSAAVRLEELWNELARRNRFTLFCAYPWSQFPNAAMAETFRHVCALHDHAAHCAAEVPPSHNPEQRLLELEQQALSLSAEIARRRAAESALAQRERELADFVENAAESIHQVGADGTILWANQAELRLLGYRWEEYVGHHIADFHVDAPVIADILARLKAGDTVRDMPARLRCKDGGIKHVLISSNGHFEDGTLRYTRCFTRDATERHQRDEAQAQREALMAELAASSRAKDEFLAMLGHELRNPLSPILTALEVIRRQGGHSVAHDIIGRQLTHLIRLVDDLLDVSRVNTGSIVLKTEALDLAQIIDKAVEMVAPLLDNRQHRFSVDVQGPLPVRGDHVRLVQIIANLLTNAARYTPPGGDIRLAASGDREHVYVSVVDNGIGIAADALPHVFDLFYQDRRTNTDRSAGGLGVGLALVNNLVGLHGGGIEARSAGPGQGSEFRVRLPRLTQAADAAPGGDTAQPASSVAQRKRILLVDDNLDAVSLMANLLELHGHDVQVFNEPLAALAHLDRFLPQIAVLDIGLPTMSGYALAGHIRQRLNGRPCRLFALTGYGQAIDRERAAPAGFEQHLVKPVRVEHLLGLIAADAPQAIADSRSS